MFMVMFMFMVMVMVMVIDIKSPAVSPRVVAQIFIIQKPRLMAATLFIAASAKFSPLRRETDAS
jgi:hypothetical protein